MGGYCEHRNQLKPLPEISKKKEKKKTFRSALMGAALLGSCFAFSSEQNGPGRHETKTSRKLAVSISSSGSRTRFHGKAERRRLRTTCHLGVTCHLSLVANTPTVPRYSLLHSLEIKLAFLQSRVMYYALRQLKDGVFHQGLAERFKLKRKFCH